MNSKTLQKLALQGILIGSLGVTACGEEQPQREHVTPAKIEAAKDKLAQFKSDCESKEGKITQVAPTCSGNNACAGLNPDGTEHSCAGQNTCGGAVSCVTQEQIDSHKS